MSEGNRYVIKQVVGDEYRHVGAGTLPQKALAVFTTEEKARKHLAHVADLLDKAPEELGRVVTLTEPEFWQLLSQKLRQVFQYFWEDPPFVWDPVEEGIVLSEMKLITQYLNDGSNQLREIYYQLSDMRKIVELPLDEAMKKLVKARDLVQVLAQALRDKGKLPDHGEQPIELFLNAIQTAEKEGLSAKRLLECVSNLSSVRSYFHEPPRQET
jgi:hypothetical protein